MKIKEIKVGNKIFKLAYGFDTEDEIIKGISSGKLDFFIVDADTVENDKYTFNVSSKNEAVITDNSQNTIVARGLNEINAYFQNNNLASIVDIIAL